MSMRVFDGIALGELVALHQDVLVLIEQDGLGGGGAAVDAHEAFDDLAGLECRGNEFLGLVALLELGATPASVLLRPLPPFFCFSSRRPTFMYHSRFSVPR